jgi:glycosyltransferase involved in cell wall biosynthesis
MVVSVIIPTYNGATKLPAILHAVSKQSHRPKEIIVAVDGSTDATVEVLESYKDSLSNLNIITQENKGRSSIRNAGAYAATGELLIFFDDDMLPLEDCIARHVIHHEENPFSILTGGLSEEIKAYSPEMLKYKSYLSNKWNNELKLSETGRLAKENTFIAAANFSLLKKTFEVVGGFDERLNDAEDFDFAVKAFKKGINLFFKVDVFAWHNDALTCESYIKRQRQYSIAQKKLVDIKPWLVDEGFLHNPAMPGSWKKKIFQTFLSRFWIHAIDKGRLKWLPQTLRYKIYDLVITANGVYFPEKIAL